MERATSLLSPSQPRTFKLWHRVYRLEMERARTTNGVIISAIRTTDFDCHASRGTLDRLIDSVSLTLIVKRDAYIPYRLAVEISIGSLLDNVLLEGEGYPVLAAEKLPYAGAYIFAIYVRTYEQLPRYGPKSGAIEGT